MRLTSTKRAVLLAFGLALIATGVLGAIKDWSSSVLVTLVVLGLVVVVAGIVGALPGGNWKEGHIQWPEIDLLDRIGGFEGRIDNTTQEVVQLRDDTAQELERLRAVCREISSKLDDYILAQEPDPDDNMTAEERLDEWREQCAALDQEISSRQFTGEDYDDGISLQSLMDIRDTARQALDREERRQAARTRYGKPKK